MTLSEAETILALLIAVATFAVGYGIFEFIRIWREHS